MEFPGNSNTQKTAPTEATPEPKKIERVTVSDAARRKTSFGRRFAETFGGGDARSVFHYVVLEVLVPAAKDTIADAVSQGVERMIFGEARSSSRRTGSRPNGYVSYNKFGSRPDPRSRERDEPRGMSKHARSNHDFGEILLATRAEAEMVIKRLFDLVEQYEEASVSDLLELVGETPDYTDSKWGWADMHGSSVRRVRDGYLLDLPRPESLA